MPGSPLGQVHFASALLAIAFGAGVLLMKGKGNRRHRRLGIAYSVTMILTNVTALMIYRLFDGFGPFHGFAIWSLIGIGLGWRAARKAGAARASGDRVARSRQIEFHYYWITWSYCGLLAAAASEAITRLPAFAFVRGNTGAFAVGVAGATLVVIAVGATLIHGRGRRVLAPFLQHRS